MKKKSAFQYSFSFITLTTFIFLVSIGSNSAVRAQVSVTAKMPPPEKIQMEIQPLHLWRPPFNLDRVGHSSEVVVTINSPDLPEGKFQIASYLEGKEVSRHDIQLSDSTPFKGRKSLSENSDQLALYFVGSKGNSIELTRQKITLAPLEFEAVAQPDKVINPIDLGAILVPADWLLLAGGQKANVKLAMLSRTKEVSSARATAWYESAPSKKVSTQVSLSLGRKAQAGLELPESSKTLERDILHVAIVSSIGKELWQKQIKVMIVPKQKVWPKFGAVKMKLRYDPPITNIVHGKNNPFSYEKAWSPEKEDYVVFLPNGSRWVFWRGSSYIPIWASRYNTGLSYEWAERISPNIGFTDCPEPLMDKELRYGRVEIVESTPARIHMKWSYQSCDFNYKVNGDYAHEDYYFYPDGVGTRVLTLTSIPEAEYEVAEFILIASQAALPFDIMPEKPMDIISVNTGEKVEINLPEKDTSWKKIDDPGIYRMRLHKNEPLAAFSFNPLLLKKPFAFKPFYDKGLVVTPAYWGGHWPLSQGFNTGRAINASIWSGPSHNSLLTWAAKRPHPVHSETLKTKDGLGVLKNMRKEIYVWLIGMTDASDETLLKTARSFAHPASLEMKGAVQDSEIYASERRAFCLKATSNNIAITIKPKYWCINPVFELKNTSGKLMKVKLGNEVLQSDDYAWDGKTLWVKTNINKPSILELNFSK